MRHLPAGVRGSEIAGGRSGEAYAVPSEDDPDLVPMRARRKKVHHRGREPLDALRFPPSKKFMREF